jgi:hypothetical protein
MLAKLRIQEQQMGWLSLRPTIREYAANNVSFGRSNHARWVLSLSGDMVYAMFYMMETGV